MMKLEEEIKQATFKNEFHKSIINIVYTSGWLSTILTQRLKPYDISIQQFNILRILRGQHPKPATVLLIQERMLDKMSNASRLVEKLRIKNMGQHYTGDSMLNAGCKGDQIKSFDGAQIIPENRQIQMRIQCCPADTRKMFSHRHYVVSLQALNDFNP